jgi:hypothetical protein
MGVTAFYGQTSSMGRMPGWALRLEIGPIVQEHRQIDARYTFIAKRWSIAIVSSSSGRFGVESAII